MIKWRFDQVGGLMRGAAVMIIAGGLMGLGLLGLSLLGSGIAPAVSGEAAGSGSTKRGTKGDDAVVLPALPRGYVRVRSIEPDIIEEMRYAGRRNFTGRRVPGYRANTCILALPVARALARAHRAARREGYRIKVYDCYRPERAVRAFVRWAEAGGGGDTRFYYPRIARHQIIPLGYVSKRSSHSLGTAVDLTLVAIGGAAPGRMAEGTKPGHEPGAGAAVADGRQGCIAGTSERGADASIDMGTSWDCFDVLSHTLHGGVTGAARDNRLRLKRIMEDAGFHNYRREWWHYSMRVRGYWDAHDFAVE